MKILTVRQPWAWAILHAGKDVENRSRNIAGDYRGPIAIHAGLTIERDTRMPLVAVAFADRCVSASETGAILGVVDLIDSHPVEACAVQQHDGDWTVCSEWAERSGHHLVLANPRVLEEPIPYRGALGLRKTDFGIEGDWLVEYHEPCPSPCAGVYGCPPSCYMDAVSRLAVAS